jgi:hypothetical protein
MPTPELSYTELDIPLSITDYISPLFNRIDNIASLVKAKTFRYPPSPKLPSPYLEERPHAPPVYRLIDNDPSIYLDNGANRHQWLAQHQPNLSPLANHPAAQLFIASTSLLGLYVVYSTLRL